MIWAAKVSTVYRTRQHETGQKQDSAHLDNEKQN